MPHGKSGQPTTVCEIPIYLKKLLLLVLVSRAPWGVPNNRCQIAPSQSDLPMVLRTIGSIGIGPASDKDSVGQCMVTFDDQFEASIVVAMKDRDWCSVHVIIGH
jgi:hypothetical protein